MKKTTKSKGTPAKKWTTPQREKLGAKILAIWRDGTPELRAELEAGVGKIWARIKARMAQETTAPNAAPAARQRQAHKLESRVQIIENARDGRRWKVTAKGTVTPLPPARPTLVEIGLGIVSTTKSGAVDVFTVAGTRRAARARG